MKIYFSTPEYKLMQIQKLIQFHKWVDPRPRNTSKYKTMSL